MNMKTTFLSEDLEEEVYIKQPEGFSSKDGKHLVCKLKKFIYGLKQTSCQWEQMKNISYASVVGNLMYVQVCTRPVIAFSVAIMGRYQSNPSIDHLRVTKKVLSGNRSKHINIKYLAIKEHVKEKTEVIEHINTELMIANPLTKGMPPSKFKDHVDRMGLGSFV
ncbi:Retrovirus-related Pol polyprotein from transposon TNT 1-94 [Vitis vinifera]|uniref:Retrovirus-related Pol polyprotein from transposon TNT 1-94 n=1 Tax=Vitis vinifera TaxID=29760 RepID=A0A438GD73_VITVI|nr:Retrovirus-related Pol polyprotein from transposon TNT 1-94 [Vitis vinifera]